MENSEIMKLTFLQPLLLFSIVTEKYRKFYTMFQVVASNTITTMLGIEKDLFIVFKDIYRYFVIGILIIGYSPIEQII